MCKSLYVCRSHLISKVTRNKSTDYFYGCKVDADLFLIMFSSFDQKIVLLLFINRFSILQLRMIIKLTWMLKEKVFCYIHWTICT